MPKMFTSTKIIMILNSVPIENALKMLKLLKNACISDTWKPIEYVCQSVWLSVHLSIWVLGIKDYDLKKKIFFVCTLICV